MIVRIKRTCVIYSITNTVNKKRYIGVTANPTTRRNEHFNKLRKGKHGNYKLQRAFNKYGAAAFAWEILEVGLKSRDRNSHEIQWISLFDSFQNGYNLTVGGEGTGGRHCKSVIWNGIYYPSLSLAAQRLGVGVSVICNRMKKGHVCDADIDAARVAAKTGTSCVWNGVSYPTIASAAQANGVSSSSMGRWVACGYTCNADIPPLLTAPKVFFWNDVEYATQKDAAKALGVSPATITRWVDLGFTCDEDVNPSKTPCVWMGVEYPSLTEAERQLGIDRHSLKNYIEKGYRSLEDVPPAKRLGFPCTWNGIEFPTVGAAALSLGIKESTMSNRLSKGYTCDEDMPRTSERQPVTWNGILYPSYSSAAKAVGIDVKAFINRIKKGYTSDADMLARADTWKIKLDKSA